MIQAAAPKQNSNTKFERQPNAVCSTPPISGADQRRQRHDRRHARKLAADAGAFVHVAHHGARQHARARAAQRLHETRRDQRLDGECQRAGQRRHEIDAERGEQHRPPAVAIRQRPVEHLRAGEADEIGRDRELNLRSGRIEQPADRRQRGQIHVDRQRAEPGQHGQQQRQRKGAGTSASCSIRPSSSAKRTIQ